MLKSKQCLIILMVLFLFTGLSALPVELSPAQVREVADKYARQLWGSQLNPAEPIPYYSPDEKIIAWHFNYAIGGTFPDRATLQQRSDAAFKAGNRDLGWGNEEFGNMVVGANRNMPVFVEYSKCLSKQYALGTKIEELAAKAFPEGYKFGKTYYLGPVSVWFAVSNGRETKYINPEPKARTYSETQFREYVESMRLFWTRDNFEDDWSRILDDGQILRLDRSAFILYREKMPYYEWHEGCTPSSASMLLAWWDNRYDNIGNLTRYTMSKYDTVQNQTDHHVTDACLSLHNHMDTDSEGSTSREDICDGYIATVENRGYNCSSDGHWAASWEPREIFNDIKGQIDQGFPVHVSIPNHSVIGVGYSDDPDMVTVHDPNMSTDRIINRGILEGAYWVHIEANPNHNKVDVLSPDGGKEWGTNNGGETLYSGEMYEIRWDSTFFPYTYAKIYYHDEGGSTTDGWTLITANTPNDGSYDWLVPPIDCFYGNSTAYGRIKIEIYNSNTSLMIASDGSHGNFTIMPGGSLPALSGILQNVDRTPDFFSANLNETGCWYVISIMDNIQEAYNPWDIELYNNTGFSGLLETATGSDIVNYLVVNNYQQSPFEYGVKFINPAGNTAAKVHKSGDPGNTLTTGTNNLTWYSTRAAEMWNLYLTPETYYFEMTGADSTADLDISVYQSNGDGFQTYQQAVVASHNLGAGIAESFHFSPTANGWYGVCVSSRTLVQTDFTINISTAGNWTGAISTDWHTPGNWSGNVVPDLNDNVVIPSGSSNYPLVNANAFIKSLTLETDATLHIGASGYLSVYGNLTVYGFVYLDNSTSVLDIAGNVSWEAGSQLFTDSNANIYCYGNWTFQNGTIFQPDGGIVHFQSNQDSYIANYDNNSSFHNLVINKMEGKTVFYSQGSTNDLKVNGQLTLQAGYLGSTSSRTISSLGQLVTIGGGFRLDNGTFKIGGNTATLVCQPNTWFNHLQINSSQQIQLGSDLTLKGNMSISNGGMAAGSWHIYAGGDWFSNNWPSPFNPGTGTVTFNGGQQSLCGGGNFNILEISNNTELHFNVNTSICNSYVYTSGALYVDGGYLTILDLAANGLTGKFYVEAGNLDIIQDSNQRIDLIGEIHINGGYMFVSGGYGMSTWPSGANSVIEMSDGYLEFTNSGISLEGNTGYTLTSNLTGGTIALAGNLACTRTDFQPTGGTFRIKRANQGTQYIYCNAASRFANLVIDTALSRDETDRPADQRLEIITLQTDINLLNDLIVLSGTLDLSGFTMNVGNDVEVSGNLVMDSTYDLLIAGSSFYWHPTATGTLTTGEIRVANSLYVLEGANFQMGTGTIFSFFGSLNDGYLSNHGTNTTFGNLLINKTDYVVETDTDCTPMTVLGNLTINSNNYLTLTACSLSVNGILNASSGSNLQLMNGSNLTVTGNATFYGDLRVETDAILTCHTGFELNQLGSIQLLGGSIVLDRAFDSSYYNFAGAVYFSGGTLNIPNNGLQIASTCDFDMTGGTLRLGWVFRALISGTFLPSGGTVEFIGANPGGIIMSTGNSFYDLKIAKSSSINVALGSNTNVSNDLIVQRGSLNLSYQDPILHTWSDYDLSVGRDVIINVGTLIAGRTANLLSVGRNWTNNGGPAYFTEGTGTVSFVSDQLATLSTEYFYHVNVNKTSTEVHDLSIDPSASVRVSGNLNIGSTSGLKLTSGSSLDCNAGVTINGSLDLTSTQTPNTLYLAGNLFDEHDTELGLLANSGCSIVFDGSTDQTFGGDYMTGLVLPLCHVSVNKSGGKVLPYNPIDVMGNFTITNGEWSYIDAGYTKNFHGNLIIETGGAYTDSTGTVNLSGSADTGLKLLGIAKFGSFIVNKTAVSNVNLTGNAIFSGTTAIQLTAGILSVNANTLKYKGTFVINTDGRLNLGPGSIFNLNDNSTFSLNGGAEFYSLGEAANPALLTSDTGYYTFSTSATVVTTIGARYTIFEKMGTAGINLSSRCALAEGNRFYHCTFRDGTVGGTLLTINSNAIYTIIGADFPSQGSSASNVTRSNTGSMYLITFSSWTGDFGGEDHDAGAGDSRIAWVQPVQPDPPLNLQITKSGGVAVLTWNPVTGATGYNIYRCFAYEDLDEAQLAGTTTGTTWTDTQMLSNPSALYYLRSYSE